MTTLIAVTADQHAGSSLAAVPPEGITLDDGGRYDPSKANVWIWGDWCDFWEQVARLRDEMQAKFYCVYNGDLVEGQHHGSTQILHGNPNAQALVAGRMFGVPRALGPDRVFVVRGTGAHVGESGSDEEGLARAWGCEICPETQTSSWWELPLEVDGVRMFFKHHPPTRGYLPHTRQAAILRMAKITWDEFGLDGVPPPHLTVFSHIHFFGDSYDAYPTRCLVTGSWQLRTGFVHARLPLVRAEIGGYVILIRDGDYTIKKIEYKPQRTVVWRESA